MLVESEVSKQLPSVENERTAIIKAVIEEIRPTCSGTAAIAS